LNHQKFQVVHLDHVDNHWKQAILQTGIGIVLRATHFAKLKSFPTSKIRKFIPKKKLFGIKNNLLRFLNLKLK